MGPSERLNQMEGGVSDSQRTGQNRTMIQDVPLEVGHAYVPTDMIKVMTIHTCGKPNRRWAC